MVEGKLIPQFEPHWDYMEEEIVVQGVLRGDRITEDHCVQEFETKFAEFVHAKHCILVTSGSAALYIAAKLMHDDEEAYWDVPANYGIFAANALQLAGKKIQVIDTGKNGTVKRTNFRMIPVYANGRMPEVDGGMVSIEDCAQHITYHTPRAVSCYSFHATKHLTLGGIGGAICCDNKETAEWIRAFKDHGRFEKGDSHEFVGGNFKVSELNAAFGLAQLAKLPDRLRRFGEIYSLYRDLLISDKNVEFIEGEPKWQMDILVDNPQQLVERLLKRGVGARRYYTPTHQQHPFYAGILASNSEYLWTHGVYLPSSTNLTDEQIKSICVEVRDALKEAKK